MQALRLHKQGGLKEKTVLNEHFAFAYNNRREESHDDVHATGHQTRGAEQDG